MFINLRRNNKIALGSDIWSKEIAIKKLLSAAQFNYCPFMQITNRHTNITGELNVCMKAALD